MEKYVRKPVIAGNWKMNKTIGEARDYASVIVEKVKQLEDADKVTIVLCPPFTALSAVADVLKDTSIYLGAQDMFYSDWGEFTGEVSPLMLKDAGCQYVIIGHSERRGTKYLEPAELQNQEEENKWKGAQELFQETDRCINLKVRSALQYGLVPIVCIGETSYQRQQGRTEQVLATQLAEGLHGLNESQLIEVIIAYEPVWAIGKGKKPATPEEAQETHSFIRNFLRDKFGATVADKMRILYGGSINEKNVSQLMQLPDVDGGLVGRASWQPDSFLTIIQATVEAKKEK